MKCIKLTSVAVALVLFTLVSSLILSNSTAAFDKTGLEEEKRYIWTLGEVDDDAVEDLIGYNTASLRDGKQYILDIERVVEYESKGNDRVMIEYERMDFDNEIDDPGEDSWYILQNDPEDYADDLEDFFDFYDADIVDSWIFFLLILPKDPEDFLKNITDYFENATVDGKSVDVKYGDIDAELKYDSDGILQELIVKYKGDTCYELTFTEVTDIPPPILVWLQVNLLWVIIGAVVLVGIIVLIVILLKRRSGY
ncbi:MAG: hypothetical protein ACTSR8_18440 [Promethearchaeota archaeon]